MAEEARDDEREALKAILWEWLGPIEADGDEMGAFADAILSAGYRKHSEPETPTVEHWAATLRAERERQIAKGYDGEHDHEHGVKHLVNWAIDYGRRGETVKSNALMLAVLDLLAKHPEPEITDETAERLEEEMESHRYRLLPERVVPPMVECACGWRGTYAREWRLHRHRAALAAALRVPVGEEEQP